MLCRKQVILKALADSSLDYNYNYELMKNIYKAVDTMDKLKGQLLHESGFIVDGKKFKLFTFTLLFKGATFKKQSIDVCYGDTVTLVVSGKQEIVEDIIKALELKKVLKIFDTSLEVAEVLTDKRVYLKKTTLYKTYSPIIESIHDGEKIVYLAPNQSKFYNALAQNLLRKYRLIYGEEYTGELYFDIENVLTIKNKNIHNIKGNFAKGYGNYNIWIEADIKMQKIAYYLGIGQKNAMGAGCLGFITGRG